MNAVSEIAPASAAPSHAPGEFRTSETLSALVSALAKASPDFGEVTRNKEVKVKTQAGEYKFRYATLDNIIAATFPALHANGLVLLQLPVMSGRGLVLISRLMHESGEFIESGLPLQGGSDPKALGSAITYARRYAASALLGVAVEDDDDAGAASGHPTETLRERALPRRQQPSQQSRPPGRDASESPPSQERGDRPSAAPVWDVVSGSTGQVQTAEDAKKWIGMWTFRLQKLEEGSKDTAVQKRATLRAMREANAAVFAHLGEAGHGAAVQEVTKACAALDTKLVEQERAAAVPA